MSRLLMATALVLAAALLPAPALASHADLRIADWNMDIGGDYVPAAAAPDHDSFIREVDKFWNEVVASDIPGRMKVAARQIAAQKPDVIALQELALYRTGPADGIRANETTVRYDMLASLVKQLKALHAPYRVAADESDLDVAAETGLGFDARIGNHNAVLVRKGLRTTRVRKGVYKDQLHFPSPVLGDISADRGWLSVDLKFGGRTLRLFDTHLEAFADDIRVKEANELLSITKRTGTTILVGDFNSRPDTNPGAYNAITAAGFVPRRTPSKSCCFDELDGTGKLDHNVDWVFSRPKLRLLQSYVFGQKGRTAKGLFASDHMGLVSVLRVR